MAPTRTHTPQPTPLGGGMGQLAYASKSGGISQVYLMNADGSGSHAITSIPEGACQPAWSPDGRKLVFISPCDSNTDYYPGSAMYIINVDGSGLLPLPTLSGGDYDPSWSPDGKYMAFTSLRNSGRPQLFILNLEDNQVVNISEKYGSDFQPRWSPDGRRLIFLSTRRGGQQVWVIDKDGQNAQQFTHGVSIINSRPSFSWNGESVIFTQVLAKGGIPRIIIAPLDFNNYQEYRLGAMPMRDASFSQDGHWVVFEGWQVAGAHDIYTVAASGAGLTQLTNDPALDFDPVWRPSAPPAEAND